MHRITQLCLAMAILLLAGPAIAGTIYTWTDADGVKRFSDSPPPEGTPNVQTTNEIESNPGAGDQASQTYDQMVDEASKSADEQFAQEDAKRAAEAEAERQQQTETIDQRVAAEKERLQQQINQIESRGLGPTFSQGQKDAMIQEVQTRIDRLESDPDAYFNK